MSIRGNIITVPHNSEIIEGDPPCKCDDCKKATAQKNHAIIAGHLAHRLYLRQEEEKKQKRKEDAMKKRLN